MTIESNKKVKVKLNANELTDVDVSFVSLVTTPANQIPFRVTKSANKGEHIMFELSSILKSGSTPAIVGVGIVKGFKGTDEILDTLGLDTPTITKQDGITLYKSADMDTEDTTTIKVSDDVAIMVTGIKKYFAPWGSSDTFAEALNSGGYFMGLNMAVDALFEMVYTIMDSANSPQEAKTAVDAVTKDFSDYVSTLTSNLPANAFVIEKSVQKYCDISESSVGVPADDDNTDDNTDDGTDDSSTDDNTDDDNTDDGNTDDDAGASGDTGEDSDPTGSENSEDNEDTNDTEEGGTGTGGVDDDATGDDDPDTVQKSDSSEDAPPAWATDLVSTVKKLSESLDEVKGKVEKSTEDINSLRDTTLAIGDDADSESSTVVRKTNTGDDVWAGSALDNLGS